MLSENPPIAALTDSRMRYLARSGVGAGYFIGVIKDNIHLADIEPSQFDVEVEVPQPFQFDGENVSIPARQFGESVVGNDVGAFFGVRQM